MSNQACRAAGRARCGDWQSGSALGFPAATAQRIHFRTIGLMLSDRGHAKDVPLLGARFTASSGGGTGGSGGGNCPRAPAERGRRRAKRGNIFWAG